MTNLHGLITNLSVQFPKAQIGYFSILNCPQKQAAKQLPIIEQITNHFPKDRYVEY
jgi:hypothetical protein